MCAWAALATRALAGGYFRAPPIRETGETSGFRSNALKLAGGDFRAPPKFLSSELGMAGGYFRAPPRGNRRWINKQSDLRSLWRCVAEQASLARGKG